MDPLPRSTRAVRGQLAGPAAVPRQAREVTVRIHEVQPGVLQLDAPFGWRSPLARTPAELAQIVASAFVEAQVAAYSRFRNRPYSEESEAGSGGVAVKREYPTRKGRRTDVHDPSLWKKDKDGLWVSPGTGRRFRRETQVVQRVLARRAEMWLPEPQAEETA